jgi:magnesium transporter
MAHRGKRWQQRRGSVRRPTGAHVPPGTVTADPHAPQPVIRLISFGLREFHEQPIQQVAEVRALLGKRPVTWINVDGLGNAEVIKQLGELFHLHPLAIEDVVNTHQRSKCEDYGDVLFFVARMMQDFDTPSEQISFFVGPGFLLTFQEDVEGDCLEPVRERLRQNRGRIRQHGPDYLLYELLDAVIDGYFPILEHYGDKLDDLDVQRPYKQLGATLQKLHFLRSELLSLRRIVWPHRDAVQSLLRVGHVQIQTETMAYLRDCYDHTIQLIDILEIYRESCADLRDFHYSQLSNRTNEIMRMLTLIATLFMPMTFIAGVYGMNFDWMPELHTKWGYPMALTIMACSATGFVYFFWRRGWLQSAEPKATRAEIDSDSTGEEV